MHYAPYNNLFITNGRMHNNEPKPRSHYNIIS